MTCRETWIQPTGSIEEYAGFDSKKSAVSWRKKAKALVFCNK